MIKKIMVGVLALSAIVLFAVLMAQKSPANREAVVSLPKCTPEDVQLEKPVDAESITVDAALSVSATPEAEESLRQIMSGEVSPRFYPERAQVNVDGLPAELILDQRITELGDGELQRLSLVNSGGSYPYHRIEELLRYDAEQGDYAVAVQSLIVADHFVVKLRTGIGEAELETLNRHFGTQTLKSMGFDNLYIIQLPEPSLDGVVNVSALFADDVERVECVYVNPICAPAAVPNDTMWSLQWGKERMGCEAAWDTETGDTNIIVAVLDIGVDLDHYDLEASIWRNPGEAGALATNGVDDDANGYIDDWIGWDFGQDDNDPEDNGDEDYDGRFAFAGHGSHCAGNIGARGNNSVGMAGVCWNVRIMALKVFEYYPAYDAMRAAGDKTVLAMKYATDKGAKITSNSYGASSGLHGILSVFYPGVSYQNDQGVLFIAAAGNDGVDIDVTTYDPACLDLPNVIAVGNSQMSETLASSSNYGEESVDIIAPGTVIYGTTPNDLIASMDGTSMAAPQVAGAAALLYSLKPEISYLNCKQLLLDGVDTFAAYSNTCVSHGRLNVNNSLNLLAGYFMAAPLANADWVHETTQTIQWFTTSTNGLSRISIVQNGSNVLTIATNVTKTDEAYEWIVSDSLPLATNYSVRIEDMTNSAVFAESDLFAIRPWFVTAPAAGDVWYQLQTQAIQWVTASTSGLSRISIVQNGSNVFTITTNAVKADQTYDWVVPESIPSAGDYRVRVEDATNPAVVAESALFSISPLFPYSESFEAGLGLWKHDPTNDFNWERISGKTPSNGTGPSGAEDGAWYLYAEASSPNHPTNTVNIEADFPFEELQTPEINFAYHMYGQYMGSLYLEISTNGGAAWNTEWSQFGDLGDQWFQTNIMLTAYAGKQVKVRFRVLTGIGITGDVGIDTITIRNKWPELLTDLSELNIPEGSTNGFQVKLDSMPTATITVSVERVSGDTNITVLSGGSLEFTAENWNTYKPVILAASEDTDWVASSTVIRCSSPGMVDLNRPEWSI